MRSAAVNFEAFKEQMGLEQKGTDLCSIHELNCLTFKLLGDLDYRLGIQMNDLVNQLLTLH